MINFLLFWFYFKGVLIKDIYVGKYFKLKFKYLIKNKNKNVEKEYNIWLFGFLNYYVYLCVKCLI